MSGEVEKTSEEQEQKNGIGKKLKAASKKVHFRSGFISDSCTFFDAFHFNIETIRDEMK